MCRYLILNNACYFLNKYRQYKLKQVLKVLSEIDYSQNDATDVYLLIVV